MHPDHSHPARNTGEAFGEHVGRVAPETLTLQLVEHVADQQGEDGIDLYLARVVAELFEMCSGVRDHISDLLLTDLTEELHRRGQQGKAAARMVAEVQRAWNQCG